MNTKKHHPWPSLVTILFLLSLLSACHGESEMKKVHEQVCVVLAHPDDETIISGTLAMLASSGCSIQVVYVTSGGEGPDVTGQGLHGESLADVREQEALTSLHAIGISRPPAFLRFPDSQVLHYVEEVQGALISLLKETRPSVVISFGPDGITNDWDHKMTGFAADFAFDLTDNGKLLLHMAHTASQFPVSESRADVSKQAVDLSVRVTDYADERVHSFDAHHTQFPQRARTAYKAFVHARRFEQFIIVRNRDADLLLQKCFDTEHR